MAKKNDTGYLRELLLGFVLEEDPMFSMLSWMVQQLMQVEAENKVGVVDSRDKWQEIS